MTCARRHPAILQDDICEHQRGEVDRLTKQLHSIEADVAALRDELHRKEEHIAQLQVPVAGGA